MPDIDGYIKALSNLRPDRSGGYPKPYKPCLLLAVIALIDSGHIQDERIYLDDNLKHAFREKLRELGSTQDQASIALPFFHLRSSGVWALKPISGMEDEYQKSATPRSERWLKQTIEYAAIDKALFHLFRNDIARARLIHAIRSNLASEKENFKSWLSGRSTENEIESFCLSLSQEYRSSEVTGTLSIFLARSIEQYKKISRYIEGSGSSIGDSDPVFMAALKHYRDYLRDALSIDAEEDIEKIETDKSLDQTEKSILVLARRGQGIFRSGLVDYWSGCAVTGYPDIRLLVASHIKPWSQSDNRERLDSFNGLLLSPNLDKVFDRKLISFNENGAIIISEKLQFPEKLGIDPNMRIERLTDTHHAYLASHRQAVLNS
ncbi:MAG: HNH endonuclease [Alcanivoracaceae bacterium]